MFFSKNDIIKVGKMNFKERYEELKTLVESNLLTFIDNFRDSRQGILYEAMKYSLEAGGKRFRPVLHLSTVDLLGKNPADFVDSATALEYIHTYSLIHDDLPAMDNDDYRRGKLTNHKVFGEDIAILAGDALLNSAYEILFSKIRKSGNLSVVEGAYCIAENAGALGMIGGQVCDVQSEGKKIDLESLLYMHLKKTGALIEASILSSAMMLGANQQQMDALKIYAYNLGIAFQVSDDILDVTADFEDLGKPIGSDERNHKSTYVSHYGLEGAQKILAERIENAISALDIFENREFLVELARYTQTRKK